MMTRDPKWIQRIEEREAQVNREYVRARRLADPQFDGAVLEVAGGLAVFTGVGSPLNYAAGIGLSHRVSPEDIRRVVEFFSAQGVDTTVEAVLAASPSLQESLSQMGFRIGGCTGVFIRNLAHWKPGEATGQVVRVDESLEMLWARTVCQGFGENSEPSYDELAFPLGFCRLPSVQAYLAWDTGEAAAGAALDLDGDVACLFSGSTRTLFRRRGHQAALIERRLADAWTTGAAVAVIQAEPGSASARNAERAGFELLYTKTKFTRSFGCQALPDCGPGVV